MHLAVGWGVGQLKVGSFARGERMAKWNEALRIEEALSARARFAGGAVAGRLAALNAERKCRVEPLVPRGAKRGGSDGFWGEALICVHLRSFAVPFSCCPARHWTAAGR